MVQERNQDSKGQVSTDILNILRVSSIRHPPEFDLKDVPGPSIAFTYLVGVHSLIPHPSLETPLTSHEPTRFPRSSGITVGTNETPTGPGNTSL